MRTSILSVLAISLCLSACSTTRLALAPIEHPTEVPLVYRTGSDCGALEAGTGIDSTAAAAAERVQVTFVRLSTAESEALLGPIGARPAALEVALADAERLLASVVAQNAGRLENAGLVALAPGSTGEIRVARQCAYVAAFELSQTPGMAIADPIVAVTEDGYLLRLGARTPMEADAFELSVELVLSDLDQPMRERLLTLPGSAIPVTVQEPAWMTQRIQTSATLSDTRALLLAGIPAREEGQTLLLVLRREKR
ncbi:MAG TPA: hypothetical protein VK843_11045 [Planctomycetota bacterium]|nr:hypothetical protein [Planctomycetota bacterium]